jgi:hypothetical protein
VNKYSNDELPTMPGAVFVPGISGSYLNNDHHSDHHHHHSDSDTDSSDDDDEESALDIPPDLVSGPSSGSNTTRSSADGVVNAADDNNNNNIHVAVAVAVEVDEKQEPQVIAVPFDEATEKKQIPFHRTKLFCRIALILLIAVIIIGLASTTILISGHNGTDDGIDYRETLGIREAIEVVIGAEKLKAVQSPYAKALEWMIHQDPMALVPGDSNFIQRYVMAYFYYATTTNGPWKSCNPAIVGGSESSFCYQTIQEYLEEEGSEKIPATRWLSSAHECEFAGVVCNDKLQVVELKLSKLFPFCRRCNVGMSANPLTCACVCFVCSWSTIVGSLPG